MSGNFVCNGEGSRSRWQCGLKQVYGCLLAVVVGLNPVRGMAINVVCCAGRVICDGDPSPEETYQVWCVSVSCDQM